MKNKQDYKVWATYYGEEGHVFIENIIGVDPIHETVLHGRKVDDPYPDLVATDFSGRVFSDLLPNYLGQYIVSAGLRKVLEETENIPMQFIPVRVKGKPKQEYWIVNILAGTSCVDRGKSVFTTFEPDDEAIFELEKWVLKSLPDTAPALIRVEELALVYLVRNDLRKKMTEKGLNPGTFVAIKDFRM